MSASAYPRLAGTLIPVFALRHDDDFGVGDTRAVREAITWEVAFAPEACRAHALSFSWQACTRQFIDNLSPLDRASNGAGSGWRSRQSLLKGKGG